MAASDHDLLSRSSLIAIDENIKDDEGDEDNDPPEGGAASLGAWMAKYGKKGTGQKRNMHVLRSTAAMMSRTLGHPNGLAANINAYLEDLGILSDANKAGPSKLRDARSKFGKAQMARDKAALVWAGIRGLYADERKDKTTIREQVETAVMRRRGKDRDHYSAEADGAGALPPVGSQPRDQAHLDCHPGRWQGPNPVSGDLQRLGGIRLFAQDQDHRHRQL